MPHPHALIDFGDPHNPGAEALRLAFGEPDQVLVAHAVDEVVAVLAQVDALSRQGCWCVGYVRYEAAPAFDAALHVHAADGPLAWFGVHTQPLAEAHADHQAEPTVVWDAGVARDVFDHNMAEIHRAIAAGELYQVNYTAPLQAQFSGSALAYFQALRRAQPRAYSAFINAGSEQVLSVSPELFFDWDGERILSRPMKGTAARGATPVDDAANATQLRNTPKERAENVMIVDLIRNDLSRIAQPHSVQVPRLFHLEALPTVWQMTSDVEAKTRPGTTLLDVFTALFPCGSITGAPKVQAMRMIKALEPAPRGVYCGAVGVVRPGGHATFNVAIRTVTVQGDTARCGIGSGITFDAQAEGEWNEWRSKRMFLERASQPFELLETLALRDGVLQHVDLHLDRMAGAAQHFATPWDRHRAQQALQTLAATHPKGAYRVRLLLPANGHFQAQAFALADTLQPVRLQLASVPLAEAHSEFVRHKTTHRAHYDAFTPVDASVFDTVLFNAQGEVTECTRGNIAVLLEGRWVTPPLASGLLPGIGRAVHLQSGRLTEAVVRVDDLQRARGLAFVNSLRGWLDAVLVAP
ncbi:aminodeoxychorismate synthase component I [Rhodoferax saidenbachensis]|uniref:Para-aminobenzoate synthetase/4-amino-4-deoxychorismate lyase n=1 Tax=Rhodoferax saidenbachensis TaxID=1484693 RepID=A0ABU1ZH83_9BURK|nr:aminodeoxychorismate synthase component I [Rhodoferax saidenbachensis]MDR7304889.1 para-aminobenzoate synthetase/4-amino-4-deoxychorismate lyase [Rhodoferax saidenbachensis]